MEIRWSPHHRRALKREVPLWIIVSVFLLLGAVAYSGLSWVLERQTQADLARYTQLVKLAPRMANVTITLP